MDAVATDIVTRIAELSDGAFTAFCEDIAGMFGVEMRCDRRQIQTLAVRGLREHFKKLTVVHLTKADGVLDGTFHLVFDQGGLFILSGVIVMLPESRIVEEAKRGSADDAANLQDAAREVGNLLVGSWDRIFREDCPGHQHFVKASTFIGKPWEKPEQIELQAGAEVVAVLYEITIEPYPSFTCAAVFPSSILNGFGQAVATADQDLGNVSEPADQAVVASVAPVQTPAEPPAVVKPAAVANDNPPPAAKKPIAAPVPEPPAPAPVKESPSLVPADVVAKPPETQVSPAPQAPATPPAPVPDEGLIPPGRRSSAVDAGMLPSELASAESGGASRASQFAFLDTTYIQSMPQTGLAEFLDTKVAEIMEKDVVWADPEETVQDVIAKMQQHNVGYVLIGANGALGGLVSGSNILGAVSLYLRPMFAKWRRPQDDATLGVKVKWIMSRPVRTVRPDATLAAAIESMRRCGGRCMPVVDSKGVVQGMITVFDILLRILQSDGSVSWSGKPPQAPPLMI